MIKSFDRHNFIGRSIFIVYSGHPPKLNSYLFDCSGKYVVFNTKKRERERERETEGKKNIQKKLKISGSRKQVIFPKLKLNFAGDCFWLLILFSYEKMWEPSTFLNFRLSLVYLLSGTCFHILNHAIF